MSEPDQHFQQTPSFRLWPVVASVLLILLGLSLANQWYAQHIAMPRYCEDPVQTLERVQRLLSEEKPAEDNFDSRRPYIVAAKLLFLVPRETEENEEEYLLRIRRHLEEQCR
jgi:hypothetical protein